MSRVRVKVCGLRARDAVDAAVDAGADAVGFVFADSPRRVDTRTAAELLAHVPAFVQRVAVFLHPSEAEVRAVTHALPIDLVQTDAEDFERGASCVPFGRRLPVVRAGEGFVARAASALKAVPTVLVEGPRSGVGVALDLDVLAALPADIRARMIVAGGLSSGNVAAVIERVRPLGVDVSSGVESAPGIKDSEKIHAFVREVRRARRSVESDTQ